MRKIVGLVISISLTFAIGCGQSSPSSGGITVSSIANLPKVTAPVSGTSSTHQDRSSAHVFKAVSGLKLANWGSMSWSSAESRAMCQTGVLVGDLLAYAAIPDALTCEIGVLDKHQVITDTSDGTAHYYSVTGFGQTSASEQIQISVTKQNGAISNFKMYDCEENTTAPAGTFYQQLYVGQALASSSANVTLAMNYQSEVGMRLTASGNIDSKGNWTSKTISNAFSMTFGSGSNAFNFLEGDSLTQFSDHLQVTGAQSGTDGSYNFSSQVYAEVQGLNMSLPSTFALGDGTAQYSAAYTGAPTVNASSASWSGDTQTNLSNANLGDYYSEVNAAQVPTLPTSEDTSFHSDETWDCNIPSGTTATQIDLNQATAPDGTPWSQVEAEMQSTCNGLALSWNGYAANCYNAQ